MFGELADFGPDVIEIKKHISSNLGKFIFFPDNRKIFMKKYYTFLTISYGSDSMGT